MAIECLMDDLDRSQLGSVVRSTNCMPASDAELQRSLQFHFCAVCGKKGGAGGTFRVTCMLESTLA